ncbi:hypothetical protein [Burkholderia ubonensis]|uniref:hypothetical protein n=1 Tax=Burkholderia ubonensis TaxID=101571 RepID=UPI00075674C0|nr:hypothetical protein [Burkholderia ubonensis]KWN65849.1 hypothetical protein WM23_07625 [Burkholderia ubonensis]
MKTQWTIPPELRDRIHFETLLTQALDEVRRYAGQTWTDLAEHDPGITLLQALSFVTSDLAYRHTLPLEDLLTPSDAAREGEGREEGIFPAEFGPQWALTCGPITADDYRRAILDLRVREPETEYEAGMQAYASPFYFRNVRLERAPEHHAPYRYWYNVDHRTLLFDKPDAPESDGNLQELTLFGGYRLYVEPGRGVERDAAKQALRTFLAAHRNLCEAVALDDIVWLDPQPVHLQMEIELEDDCMDAGSVLKEIYAVSEAFISPAATRETAEALRAEGLGNDEIYHGPKLEHGWIRELPEPLQVEGWVLNISLLANQLSKIGNVKRILRLGVEGDSKHLDQPNWTIKIKANHYPLLWGAEPLEKLTGGNGLVTLLKRGRPVAIEDKDLEQLTLPAEPWVVDAAPPPLKGRHRRPGRYFSAGDKLPPCYGLQDPHLTEEKRQLHQFLLPFEQQLANGCDQLALLPKLLAFTGRAEGRAAAFVDPDNPDQAIRVWGAQLPFVPGSGSVADRVHGSEGSYVEALQIALAATARDRDKELAIIDYLLRYFGKERAPRTLVKGEKAEQNFLTVQRSYLAQQTELAYRRASIQVNQVSAVQRRIAARLGLGQELFGKAPPLDDLSFYLVEHRALVPRRPNATYDAPQAVKNVKVVENGDDLSDWRMTLTLEDDVELERGYLFDLYAEDKYIRGLRVAEVEGNTITVYFRDHTRLQLNYEQVLKASTAKQLFWQNCNAWLKDQLHALAYADDQNQAEPNQNEPLPEGQKRLKTFIYPTTLSEGNTIAIEAQVALDDDDNKYVVVVYPPSQDTLIRPDADAADEKPMPFPPAREARVISVDPVSGTFVAALQGSVLEWPNIENQQQKFRWHIEEHERFDRFSFIVSVVFNLNLIKDAVDPVTTMAWIKDVVREEMPCHITTHVHWFDQQRFNDFKHLYKHWLDGDQPRDLTYQMLTSLSLGNIPDNIEGIGALRIASPEQAEAAVGPNYERWDERVILQHELFYIPRKWVF